MPAVEAAAAGVVNLADAEDKRPEAARPRDAVKASLLQKVGQGLLSVTAHRQIDRSSAIVVHSAKMGDHEILPSMTVRVIAAMHEAIRDRGVTHPSVPRSAAKSAETTAPGRQSRRSKPKAPRGKSVARPTAQRTKALVQLWCCST